MFICDRTFWRASRGGAALAALVGSAVWAAPAPRDPQRALSPAAALASLRVEPGLRVELVAAEPLVVSPVAFTFDERGRLFVAEGRGYPDPIPSGPTSEGRVVLLTDADGDGRYDKRTDFATGLGYVNGITPWRGGFFVTAAPDIVYLKDTNGDDVADEKQVVLTGFEATRTAQIRVSHPSLGFDGRMYVTSGLNGGKVVSPLHPERPAVTFTPRDGRFHPDTFEFENTGGRGQFGLTFDGFGRRFICSNRHPVLHVMLEPWHLRRNPHLAFSEMTQEVSKVEAQAKVLPISKVSVTADFMPKLMGARHSGTFTSASAVTIFGGTALTPAHRGNAFICEPAQNLVQRQVLRPEGTSFRSDVADREREFLASTDSWFRPVFMGNGPDGALYVADMHRREIDHPQYVPEESRRLLDFESGKGHGRIYRIVKEGATGARRAEKTTTAPALAQLVAELESPDSWWRDRAQRLLLERADPTAVALVEKVASGSRLAEGRARALWTLHGLGALSSEAVATALGDATPAVREQGVLLAGELLASKPTLLPAVIGRARDADARVRFAAALVLGSVESAEAVPALAEIAARDGEDRWTRAAVLSGIGSRMDPFLTALQSRREQNPKAFAAMMEHLGRVFGAGAPVEACRRFLNEMLTGEGDLSWRVASVVGIVEGFRGRDGAKGGAKNPFTTLVEGGAGERPPALQKFLESAGQRALNERLATPERVSAISLLGYTDMEFAGEKLGRLLDTRQPPEVQLQAVRALERIGDPRGGALLVSRPNWSRYTPQIKEAAIATLSSKPALIEVLFGAIQGGVIAPAEISSTRRTQLMKHADAKVKATAEAIFKELEGGDRMAVYRTLRDVIGSNTNVAKGREVFVRACSACHTHGGTGGMVGPDLSGVRNQPADALLLHIIVPNYEVAPSYQTLSLTTNDGRSITGWLAGESEASLSLRTAAGTEESVLRSNIATLSASGLSLMPDGLEQAMTRDEVSALLAFLKNAD